MFFKRLIRKYGWLLLSHHPRCPPYKNSTIRFVGLEICRGCVIGYSVAIVTATTMLLSAHSLSAEMAYVTAIAFGVVVLALACYSTLWYRDIRNTFLDIVHKVCRGLAFGFVVIGTALANELFEIVVFGIPLVSAAIVYNILRYKKASKQCQSCRYLLRGTNCPGLVQTT